jgi:hypothetical protein
VATGTRTKAGAGEASAAGQLAREVSSLQAKLLGKLHEELTGGDAAFAVAAQRLAEEFGSVTATAVGTLWEREEAEPAREDERHPSLFRPGQMRRRLEQLIEASRRYEHPFALVVFDVEGPGARAGDGDRETALAVVGAALSDGSRLLDEAYRLEEDALRKLDELEDAGGLPIGVTAGVVACPEHGHDADGLLHKADEAMWRARAVGQPVGVGALAR